MFGRVFSRAYRKVSAPQAAALVNDGALLLDVREIFEWRAGHAPQARHIPLSDLSRRMRELPGHRPIVTVCHSGHRSARAAALLAGDGREVWNLSGGMRAWVRAGLPVVSKGGRPHR
jgi:rhodanese-related sulfurtransferase